MEVLNSFSAILCFVLVFLKTQLYFAVSQKMLKIIRNSGSGGLWTDLDQFILDDSECAFNYCSDRKGLPVLQSNCHCQCSNRQSATFGFYSGSWTCLANTEVRKQGELCKYKFRNEQDHYPLRILEQSVQDNVVLLPSTGCSVELATSRYFTCEGRWAGIESQSFGDWFSIHQQISQSANGHRYEVMIGSGISYALLGRIISLNITCPQESSCLLFKLQGTIQCAENVSAIRSPTTPTTTATATATATAVATTSEPNATADPNEKGKNEKAESSGSSSTVVGVVVTLVILVVIVIVIAAYVYRKRKRGESIWLVDYFSSRVRNTRSTQPKKTAEETQEDPEYAEIPEGQQKNEPMDQAGGVYSYAFDDPHTAYTAPQQAPYNKLVHNPRGPEEEGAIYSTADDGPVYNVLERLPAENQIMMAPESTMNEGPFTQAFEPEYQVLEGPDTTEETTDAPFNTDVRASVGEANPGAHQTVAPKERRRPPSPPRKI